MHLELKVIEGDQIKTYLLTQHEMDRILKRNEVQEAPSVQLPWVINYLLKKYVLEKPCEETIEKSEA